MERSVRKSLDPRGSRYHLGLLLFLFAAIIIIIIVVIVSIHGIPVINIVMRLLSILVIVQELGQKGDICCGFLGPESLNKRISGPSVDARDPETLGSTLGAT